MNSQKNSGSSTWNERYDTEQFVYGTQPNDFLHSVTDVLPKGKVLSLGEGEGRNAVYLAKLGYEVTALDYAETGLEKAMKFAREQGVSIKTIVADLSTYDFPENEYDVILLFFCHLPEEVRKKVFNHVGKALKDKGVFVMEVFAKEQLQYQTGGPKSLELLVSLDEVRTNVTGLDFKILQHIERPMQEGKLHNGKSSVIQVLAVKKQ